MPHASRFALGPGTGRLEVLLAHLRDAVLLEDENRHIVYVNRALVRMFGIPLDPPEMTGLDCAAMAGQTAAAFRDPEAFLARVAELLEHGLEAEGERVVMADGRVLERDYVPMFDDGRHTGHLWLYRDVTEEVRHLAELRAGEADLRAIVDNAVDPIWSVDDRLRLVRFNRAFGVLSAARTGWVPVEGGPVAHSISDLRRDREMRGYHLALQGTAHDFEIEVEDGGELRVFEVNLAPVFDGTAVRGVTAATRDVSSARRTTDLLRKARDAAESANRAKSDFLAHVSHEIRTPLNAVMGMVDLALDTGTDPRQRSYLTAAQSNSEMLLTLISDVLDFSKIEAGEMDLERQPFSPRDVVEDVVRFLSVNAVRKGLQLTFDASTVPARIVGDAHRYRQVAMNLVGNAIKYTEQGVVQVRLAGRPHDDGRVLVELEVHDTGQGIAAADQARVFSRFFRTRDSSRASGTGLGLAITSSLVQLMGGEITLDSTVGKGSTFRASMPVRPLPHVDELVFTGRAVVARHSPAAASWPSVVHELGFEVQVVDSGPSLLDAVLKGASVDLVVVEDGLPGPHLASLISVVQSMPGNEAQWLVVSSQVGLPHIEGASTMQAPLVLSGLRSLLVGPEHEGIDLRRGARMLVAEDHEDSREMVVNLLRRAGHNAVAVEDGRSAWEVMASERFELALIDMDMPRMDGLELCRRVRAREAEAGAVAMPLVMVSGHATEDHRARAREAGVTAFVPKPINRRRLMDVLDQCLDLRPLVLVADDAPDARRLLRTWFLAAGARVVEASDGQEALAIVARDAPDVLVLDMQMPTMDGFAAARALRKLGADLPVLGLTGLTGSEARRQVLGAGCTSYLSKPCRREQLIDAVAALLWQGTEMGSVSPTPQRATVTRAATPPRPSRRDAPDVDDGLAELVPLYLDERMADVEALRRAIAAGDGAELRRRGHRMKGTAEPYGFPEIGELGRALERAGVDGDLSAALQAVDRLDQVLRAARTTSRGSTRP